MPLNLSTLLSSSVTDTLSKVNDIVHSWVTTNKDKVADATAEEQLKAQITEAFQTHQDTIEQAYLADVQSARVREVDVATAKGSNWIQPALAIIGVGGFFAIVAFVVVHGLKTMDSQTAMIVGTLLGTTGSVCVGVYNYYFGSSTGSKTAQETIATIAKQP